MKSKEEIEKEIEALEAVKVAIPKLNLFGDDNHELVDLQIKILKENLDMDAIEEVADKSTNYPDMIHSGREAHDWLYDYGEPPSDSWSDLI